MTGLIAGGVVLALGAGIVLLMLRQARKRGRAEYAAEAEKQAREAEQDMTAAVHRDRDTSDDIEDLEGGRF